jgi:hypothetical protein
VTRRFTETILVPRKLYKEELACGCIITVYDPREPDKCLTKGLERRLCQDLCRGKPTSFAVTDPDEDAPDGAEVDGFVRVGKRWEPLPVTYVFDDKGRRGFKRNAAEERGGGRRNATRGEVYAPSKAD